MKTLILNLILFTCLFISCKKEVINSKQKTVNEASTVKVKKEEVMYPYRDPYSDDLCTQYKNYLNRTRNGGC